MPSSNKRRNDLRTEAIILHRTKYGETDRILNLITPVGRKSCVAKGVRKEKSKMAGGIEIFTVSDITIHESEKSEMGILTSAKMKKNYMNIIADINRFELGSKIIKITNRVSENVDSPELYNLIKQCYWALDKNIGLSLVETYFLLNVTRISGEDVNLHRDTDGEKLKPDETYVWDTLENALKKEPQGNIKADHIKIMRMMLVSPLKTIVQIQNLKDYIEEILYIARSVAKS